MVTEWLNPNRINENDKTQLLLFLRHKKAYKLAEKHCQDKKVLEIGCGAGYGAATLSERAKKLICIDTNIEAVFNAKKNDSSADLNYSVGNPLQGLPFNDNEFSVVILFQVIEHIELAKMLKFLIEIKRVIKNNGKLILSTPNKKMRLLPFQKPWNEYHKKEYDYKELVHQLKRVFPNVNAFGLGAHQTIINYELQRIKQTPYVIYLRNPLGKIIKVILPKKIIKIIKKKLKSSNLHNCQIKKKKNIYSDENTDFSLKDFYFTEIKNKKLLDLFAICHKNVKN